MPPTVLDVCQVKYKKTFSRGKKSRECFVVCEKVPTFASAFREQPDERQKKEFFDRLRQTEDM